MHQSKMVAAPVCPCCARCTAKFFVRFPQRVRAKWLLHLFGTVIDLSSILGAEFAPSRNCISCTGLLQQLQARKASWHDRAVRHWRRKRNFNTQEGERACMSSSVEMLMPTCTCQDAHLLSWKRTGPSGY
jgi:hypothetical protein